MKIVDVVDQLPRHPKRKYSRRPLTRISTVVVHHSATASGSPEAFARYHVEAHDWPGIGYHYVIAKDGTVYKTNNASTVSYHAKGANLKSLGVCLIGNFDREHPGDVQMDALVELLHELMKAYGISPDNVIGHREVPGTQKSCPGANFDMDALRARLRGEAGGADGGGQDGQDGAVRGGVETDAGTEAKIESPWA